MQFLHLHLPKKKRVGLYCVPIKQYLYYMSTCIILHITSLADDKKERLAEARHALAALGLMDEVATSKTADVYMLCLCSTVYFDYYPNSCSPSLLPSWR